MRIDVHIHTENTDLFQGEKKDMQGQIAIPKTKATFQHFGLTSDKSMGRATSYILNCWLDGNPTEVDKITDWLYSKVKDKAEKITIGDLRGKSDYVKINREEILEVLNKWIK